ncbi:MAG: hypothetical protein AAGG72_09485 [Pseudomonadota bacterium]
MSRLGYRIARLEEWTGSRSAAWNGITLRLNVLDLDPDIKPRPFWARVTFADARDEVLLERSEKRASRTTCRASQVWRPHDETFGKPC